MTIFPDLSALVVFAIVIGLAFVLRRTLFEPLARVMEQREERAADARVALRTAEGAAEASREHADRVLAESRGAAYAEMDGIRAKASAQAAERLAESRERAARTVKEGERTLRAQSDQARADLEKAAGPLADALLSRVLGRA